MIPNPKLNIWEHSRELRELCRQRALGLAPEMDCAAQAADLLVPLSKSSGLRLLDVGCGGGHLIHSLKKRGIKAEYFGIDSSPAMVEIAKKAFEEQGFGGHRIMLGDIGQLTDFDCDLAVLVNTLSFNPDFRAPLQRVADAGAMAVVIRDNFGPKTEIRWETDGFLNEGFNHLKGYWNRWSLGETTEFLDLLGFEVFPVEDRRVGGGTEKVVNKPYHWSWLVAKRRV
jgi:ubiquinone/menaquinone biosynthesis C-methylase UbiE